VKTSNTKCKCTPEFSISLSFATPHIPFAHFNPKFSRSKIWIRRPQIFPALPAFSREFQAKRLRHVARLCASAYRLTTPVRTAAAGRHEQLTGRWTVVGAWSLSSGRSAASMHAAQSTRRLPIINRRLRPCSVQPAPAPQCRIHSAIRWDTTPNVRSVLYWARTGYAEI